MKDRAEKKELVVVDAYQTMRACDLYFVCVRARVCVYLSLYMWTFRKFIFRSFSTKTTHTIRRHIIKRSRNMNFISVFCHACRIMVVTLEKYFKTHDWVGINFRSDFCSMEWIWLFFSLANSTNSYI